MAGALLGTPGPVASRAGSDAPCFAPIRYPPNALAAANPPISACRLPNIMEPACPFLSKVTFRWTFRYNLPSLFARDE